MKPASYSFGDTDLAARRLALVASVFQPASRAFLEDALRGVPPPAVAVDLGCGPGYSTELLAEVSCAELTVGLDASEQYVSLARERAPSADRLGFEVYDVTSLPLPLPGETADLLYCRLLLAHLPDPVAMATRWLTQLASGGILLLDEVEWIETAHPVLERYEEIVVGLVASKGGPMYAGPLLGTLERGDGWEARSNDVRVVPVATADAARMYGMNLAVWRDDPWVLDRYGREPIDGLAADLAALADSPGSGEITWGLRQISLVATG